MVPEKPSPGYGTINQKFVGEPSSHSGVVLLFLFFFFFPHSETHILRSSPYFLGEFLTLNGKVVVIENDTMVLKDGFLSKGEVRILAEELFYNNEYQPFKVIRIGKPLEHKPTVSSSTFFFFFGPFYFSKEPSGFVLFFCFFREKTRQQQGACFHGIGQLPVTHSS